jgi:hypothetical protein
MTREEFEFELKRNGYSHRIEGDNVIVTHTTTVDLSSLKDLPSGVEFRNPGHVFLSSLEELPFGVRFLNEGDVVLESIRRLEPGVEFANGKNIWLDSLRSLDPGVQFENGGKVFFKALIGQWSLAEWKGNIKGISTKDLINLMVKSSLFGRR